MITRSEVLGNSLKSIFSRPGSRALLALIMVLVIGFVFNADGAFLKLGTHRDALRQMSVYGILACGLTPVIISGGIDLGVGSVLALAAVVDLIIISPKKAQPLTEPVANAVAAGEWIAKTLGGKGNVVELMGLQTSTPGQGRHNGFLEGIAGTDIKVIFGADMKWLEPDARKEMESALARFDKIDLVYADNNPGAHGAWLAARATGREQQMKFVGVDALPQEGVSYVKQRILDVTFQYPTGGAEAIETALKVLHGESVRGEIILGTRVFTKENVAQGGEELK